MPKKQEKKKPEHSPTTSSATEKISMTRLTGITSPTYSASMSNNSRLTFKNWHKRMQLDHDQSHIPSFAIWRWYFKVCTPCRKFDEISYEKQLCKCCCKFKTFKAMVTILLLFASFYGLLFSVFYKELLPGGTLFFLFILFISSYVLGFIMMLVGLPPMFGNLLVGLVFGNLPKNYLPSYDGQTLHAIADATEKILLLLAFVRSGLLLDLSRIKSRVLFILSIAFAPLISEFLTVLICGHFVLNMPWEWSALLGSTLVIVSLASLTSLMQKNLHTGYGEDKHLSTVLIAASTVNVLVGSFLYVITLSYIFPARWRVENHDDPLEPLTVREAAESVVEQTLGGLLAGIICGVLVAFFPDKHYSEAAALRILVIGVVGAAIGNLSWKFQLEAGGILGITTMCVIASNLWEEMGWHKGYNPVQYFYTSAYYFGSPLALSLMGFSLHFCETTPRDLGLSIFIIFVGLTAREIICYVVTLRKDYPTTVKEKIYICIAWVSKGSFQALLSFLVEFTLLETNLDANRNQLFYHYIILLKQTVMLAILLTTPLACYSLNLLTPKLLKKKEHTKDDAENPREENMQPETENTMKEQQS